jgi:hypothetical protein
MYPLHLLCDKAAICKSTNSQILKTPPLIFNFSIFVLIKYKVISLIYNLSFKIEIFKSNPKNGKSIPNHDPKSTLIPRVHSLAIPAIRILLKKRVKFWIASVVD